MIRIQREDFSLQTEVDALVRGHPSVGGVVSFVGTVRDFAPDARVTALELEHYPGMTEAELARIEAAALARFEVEAISVVHRIGHLTINENIVLVVAAARHRAAAFDACRFMIDHLKVRATFWKKELTEQGERWVDSCPGCEAAASQWAELRALGHTHGHDAPSSGAPLPHPAAAHHTTPHTHHESAAWNGLRVGILTLSDSRTLAEDKSGDALEGLARAAGAVVAQRALLPDDETAIRKQLIEWADRQALDVILTTGGTGPGPRDVTPEATRAVCHKEMPGVAELLRREGLQQVRSAVLTRGVTALRGHTLIINLPGSSRGAAHGFGVIADLAPHILRMVHGGGHG